MTYKPHNWLKRSIKHVDFPDWIPEEFQRLPREKLEEIIFPSSDPLSHAYNINEILDYMFNVEMGFGGGRLSFGSGARMVRTFFNAMSAATYKRDKWIESQTISDTSTINGFLCAGRPNSSGYVSCLYTYRNSLAFRQDYCIGRDTYKPLTEIEPFGGVILRDRWQVYPVWIGGDPGNENALAPFCCIDIEKSCFERWGLIRQNLLSGQRE